MQDTWASLLAILAEISGHQQCVSAIVRNMALTTTSYDWAGWLDDVEFIYCVQSTSSHHLVCLSFYMSHRRTALFKYPSYVQSKYGGRSPGIHGSCRLLSATGTPERNAPDQRYLW